MENSTFQERVSRLKEVNEVIQKLDPAIREVAFSLLAGYVTGPPYKGTEGAPTADALLNDGDSLGDGRPSNCSPSTRTGNPPTMLSLIAAYRYTASMEHSHSSSTKYER